MRHGSFFTTFSGIKFYPLDPRPEEILIEDVAHALSMVCRFGGHTRIFYSVAQHSVLVSSKLPDELKFVGLMHDATEAYLGDMIRPLKLEMPEYREVENKLWKIMAEKWGLPEKIPDLVKYHDNCALMTERRDLIAATDYLWGLEKDFPAYEEKVQCMKPVEAEFLFHELFKKLNHERSKELQRV